MNKPKIAASITAALVLCLVFSACKSVPSEELKQSIQIVDLDTKWVSKYYQPWPQRLILVPMISFRVKNVGPNPLKHVNFNAIFKFKGDTENLGDHFVAGIRSEALNPGETSGVIEMKSNFGVEGRTVATFKDNALWKPAEVKLFARSRGSDYVVVGEWDVSRTIDFKEPAPVDIKKEEPKTNP
ncbi:MAG: hypothetical protein H6P98_1684 [Candidatus Aminicenantes bacterium]|nr:hypothetical protein [Candidatus Aminicenantes bacterium]